MSGAKQESSLQLKKTLLDASAAVIVGAAGLMAVAQPASARVVCNSYGEAKLRAAIDTLIRSGAMA